MRALLTALVFLATISPAAAQTAVVYSPTSQDDPEIAALIAADRESLASTLPTDMPSLGVARVGGSVIVQGSNPNACGASNCKAILYRGGKKLAEILTCDGSAGDHRLIMQGRWLSACGWLVDLATGKRPRVTTHGEATGVWMHNNSEMWIDGLQHIVSYAKPKASIAGTISRGDVLMVLDHETGNSNAPMAGTAYVYKRGCDPAPYPVRQVETGDSTVMTFVGRAPIREKTGCSVTGWRDSGPNNVLTFVATEFEG